VLRKEPPLVVMAADGGGSVSPGTAAALDGVRDANQTVRSRPEKLEKLEKVEKLERLERVEKVEKVEKLEKLDKSTDKTEKIEKVERLEKTPAPSDAKPGDKPDKV
jgi:hypothetical protein